MKRHKSRNSRLSGYGYQNDNRRWVKRLEKYLYSPNLTSHDVNMVPNGTLLDSTRPKQSPNAVRLEATGVDPYGYNRRVVVVDEEIW